MSRRKSLFGISGIILSGGMVAFAQQPQITVITPNATLGRDRIERMERRRERMALREGTARQKGMHRKRGRGIGRLLRELNLTDQQRQQGRAIMQRRLEGTRAQREELFQLREKRIAGTFTDQDKARARALHEEMRASREGVRAEMEGILTAEQKTKLEELKKERKAKIELRMKERQENGKNKQ